MRILTAARAAIDADHRQANELPDPERERRVAIYAAQVEACGRITAWLPPAEPRSRSRSRFYHGDVLRPHRG
ncbi:MAG TPA: hypothetical protein PKG77_21075 [Phycisphaerae bacterium]|nr:hypothetical protein [Phycisphaerae bacterium]HQL76222.1 hypothetical protein [Phycisphaerae bacterium]